MRRRLFCPALFAACLSLTGGGALAQDPAAADVASFADWSQRLSADLYQEREAAEDDLLSAAFRDPALAALVREQANLSENAEVRSRCQSIVEQLDRRAAFGPTLISIDLDNVSPVVAAQRFTEVCAVAGIEIDNQISEQQHLPAGDEPVSVQLDDAPFHEACRTFSSATGLRVQVNGEHYRLMPAWQQEIFPASDLDPATGAVAILLRNASRTYNSNANFVANEDGGIRRVQGGGRHDLRLNLEVHIEPKVRPLGSAQIELEVAETPEGQSLLPTVERRGNRHNFSPAHRQRNLMVSLDGEAALRHDRLTRLRGTIHMEVAREIDEVSAQIDLGDTPVVVSQTTNLPLNVAMRNSVTSVELTGLRLEPNRLLHLTLKALPPADRRNDVHQWVEQAFNGITVADASGRTLNRHGVNLQRLNDDGLAEINVRLHAPHEDSAGPLTVTWKQATSTTTLEVPFEFLDIPLPPSP